MSGSLPQKFTQAVRQISREDHWLVGLSGGADSVALLHLCLSVQSPQKICALHLNHSLRGGESAGDETFCRELCAALGVEFVCRCEDVSAFARENGLNLEDAARRLRRMFFSDEAEARQPATVLLAHHQDDQIETVLQRLMRGSGWRGLSGIAADTSICNSPDKKLVRLFRPLLDIPRKEILDWLHSQKLVWREDSSNQANTYFRNRLRNGVIPALRLAFADLPQQLLALAEYAADEDGKIESAAKKVDCLFQYGGWFIPHGQSVQDDAFVRCVEMCAEKLVGELRFNSSVTTQLMRFFSESAAEGLQAVDLPGSLRIRREMDGFFLFCADKLLPELLPCTLDHFPAVVETADWKLEISEVHLSGDLPERDNPRVEYILAGLVDGRLQVAGAHEGMRVGIAGGSKKVSDILSEHHIPQRARRDYPLLADESGILWLPPLRISWRVLDCPAPFTGRFFQCQFHNK